MLRKNLLALVAPLLFSAILVLGQLSAKASDYNLIPSVPFFTETNVVDHKDGLVLDLIAPDQNETQKSYRRFSTQSPNGRMRIYEGTILRSSTYVQGIDNSNDVELRYCTGVLLDKQEMKKSGFDDKLGWNFSLRPGEYGQAGDNTLLQVQKTVKRAIRNYLHPGFGTIVLSTKDLITITTIEIDVVANPIPAGQRTTEAMDRLYRGVSSVDGSFGGSNVGNAPTAPVQPAPLCVPALPPIAQVNPGAISVASQDDISVLYQRVNAIRIPEQQPTTKWLQYRLSGCFDHYDTYILKEGCDKWEKINQAPAYSRFPLMGYWGKIDIVFVFYDQDDHVIANMEYAPERDAPMKVVLQYEVRRGGER